MDFGSPADELVFRTKWFQVVARRQLNSSEQPHFCLKTLDYVCVVAVTTAGELLLVRQFRPVLWSYSLEIPSGHIEEGQTPEEAARLELLEETGYEADRLEFLANLSPDTGRLSNRLWCYFAGGVVPTTNSNYEPESGIELIRHPKSVGELMQAPEFCSALHRAAIFAAVTHGKLKL